MEDKDGVIPKSGEKSLGISSQMTTQQPSSMGHAYTRDSFVVYSFDSRDRTKFPEYKRKVSEIPMTASVERCLEKKDSVSHREQSADQRAPPEDVGATVLTRGI